MEENWRALQLGICADMTVKKALHSMGIVATRKPKSNDKKSNIEKDKLHKRNNVN